MFASTRLPIILVFIAVTVKLIIYYTLLFAFHQETYINAPSNHLPEFLQVVCKVLTKNMAAVTPQELTVSLSLCSKILSKIQPSVEAKLSVTTPESDSEESEESGEIRVGNPTIQQCVSSFQDFFLSFFRVHVFADDLKLVVERAADLSAFVDCTYEDQQKLLETLLWKCLGVHLTIDGSSKPVTTTISQKPLETKPNVGTLSEPFGYACQLLLELSSFPVYCNGPTGKPRSPSSTSSEKALLPDWLNLLLLCCCFVEDSDFHFISSATVLDLISITKGVVQESGGSTPDEPKGAVVSVKIAPVLTIEQLMYIERETLFYSMAAMKLWNYLGSNTSQHHLKAVQLLVLLQNLSADASVCEDLLGRAMTQQDDQVMLHLPSHIDFCYCLSCDFLIKFSWAETNLEYEVQGFDF